jgi:hypothetical protein
MAPHTDLHFGVGIMNLMENLGDTETWKRGLAIVAFAMVFSVAKLVLWGVVLFQFLFVLVTAESNPRLRLFGQQLSTYIYQIMTYITFNSDDMPYPFDDWPKGAPRR